MSDSFTETSSKSWFERLKDSIKSILLGVVLFIIAFPVLWWNEGRAVQTAKSLAEGAAAVVSVPADNVDAANENKLVHTTGMATTEETLTDGEFGVSQNAIKLIRHVEMYQWHEEEHKETKRQTGGSEKTTTTYTYDTEWSDGLIDSSDFKKPSGHQNPTSMPFDSDRLTAKLVTLGAFKLSASQVGMLSQAEQLSMTNENLQQAPEAVRQQLQIRKGAFYRPVSGAAVGNPSQPKTPAPKPEQPAGDSSTEADAPTAEATENIDTTPADEGTTPADEDTTPADEDTTPADEGTTPADEDTATEDEDIVPVEGDGATGEDGEPGTEGEEGGDEAASQPATTAQPAAESSGPAEVGDVRITFSVVKPMTVSLIAQQSGDSFRSYQTKAGDALDMLTPGDESAEQMIEEAVAANNRLTWILRLVGFGLMMAGVSMVFGPLAVVADVLPILGDLARGGIFVLALAISLPLSLLTIALAWLAYRPVLGIGLIVVAVVVGTGIFMMFRKKRPAK